MIGVIRKIKGERTYWIDGKQVSEEEFDRRTTLDAAPPIPRSRKMKRGYPIKSVALAVDSSQVQEAQDHARKLGVPTDFTPDGRMVIRDAAHKKAYMRAYGFHDRNSFC